MRMRKVGSPDQISKKVLIIGIDGCTPEALQAAKTPTMDSLLSNGCYSFEARSSKITTSGPAWCSLLTGVWPEKHGVTDNTFVGARFDRHPSFLGRLKEYRPEARTAMILNWEPLITCGLEAWADVSVSHTSDRQVAAAVSEHIAQGESDIVFVQLEEVDQAGHSYGFDPAAPNYLSAIAAADSHVGTIIDVLRERKTDDWLVIVTTDHSGGVDGIHDGIHATDIPAYQTIFMIASGSAVVRGPIAPAPFIVDIAPTALGYLGVTMGPAWGLEGRAVIAISATAGK